MQYNPTQLTEQVPNNPPAPTLRIPETSGKAIPTFNKKSGDPEAKKKSRGDWPFKTGRFPVLGGTAQPSPPSLTQFSCAHSRRFLFPVQYSPSILPKPKRNPDDHSSASYRIASKQSPSSSSSSQISISLILHHDFAIPLRFRPL